MVEISRGRGVFLYEDQLINAKSKSSSTSAACFLLSCFYKNEELVGRNLTGANEKESVHPDILLSILGKNMDLHNHKYHFYQGFKYIDCRNETKQKICASQASIIKLLRFELSLCKKLTCILKK